MGAGDDTGVPSSHIQDRHQPGKDLCLPRSHRQAGCWPGGALDLAEVGVCSPEDPPRIPFSMWSTHPRGENMQDEAQNPRCSGRSPVFSQSTTLNFCQGRGREPEGRHWSHLSNKHAQRPLDAVLGMEDPASASRTHGSSTQQGYLEALPHRPVQEVSVQT